MREGDKARRNTPCTRPHTPPRSPSSTGSPPHHSMHCSTSISPRSRPRSPSPPPAEREPPILYLVLRDRSKRVDVRPREVKDNGVDEAVERAALTGYEDFFLCFRRASASDARPRLAVNNTNPHHLHHPPHPAAPTPAPASTDSAP